MNDHLVRAVTGDKRIRAMACVVTGLTREACRRHDAYPTAAVALGRALAGGALMSALLKGEQRLALKFEGNGPLRKLIVEVDGAGHLKGYVAEPQLRLPPGQDGIQLAPALGRAGLLTVTKDLGLKAPYKGVVALYNSEIASDLAYYLTESEQVPSAVSLGVYVEPSGQVAVAGGFMVQSLPPPDEALVGTLAERIEGLPPVSELLRSGLGPREMLDRVCAGLALRVLEERPLVYRCSCTRERVEQALVSLGPDEVHRLLADQEDAEVTCEFCRKRYRLPRRELERLLSEMQ